MIDAVELSIFTLVAIAALCVPAKERILTWIILAYTVAWALVYHKAPELWTVAALGFVQNVAFTFVSRGRNSGSLGYHLGASIFSNGIYAALLFVSIDQVSQAKSMPILFLVIYTLATMSGSIFAHWLALKIEKGKARTVTEDKYAKLERHISELKARFGGVYNERLIEGEMQDGRPYRIWLDPSKDAADVKLEYLLKDPGFGAEATAEAARLLCERLEANAVQVGKGKHAAVYYREWP